MAFFTASSGDLCRDIPSAPVVRARFAYHFREINTGAELRASLRAGPYTWPGGYQLAFLASDGETICFECARAELRNITHAIRTRSNDGWRVVGIVGEHESGDGTSCHCAHCSKEIWRGEC